MDTRMTPTERSLRATVAAHERWARTGTEDRAAAMRRLNDARWQKYLDRVDPAGKLPEDERTRRAESLRRADMARLALAAATARRKKRDARRLDTLNAEADALLASVLGDDEDQADEVAA